MKMKNIIMIVVIILFLNPGLVFASADDWGVILFAGPGKGDYNISSLAVGSWTGTTNRKIYATSYRGIYSQSGSGGINTEIYIYEFIWDDAGKTWIRNTNPLGSSDMYGIPRNMVFDNLINNSNSENKMYASSLRGTFYEYSYQNTAITKTLEVPTTDPSGTIHGFAVGQREPGGKKYLYAAAKSGIEEYSWDGTTLAKGSVSAWNDVFPDVHSIIFGDGHNTGRVYMYIEDSSSNSAYELKFSGGKWRKNTTITNCSYMQSIGRPVMFVGNAGNGVNFYSISSNGVKECKWTGLSWQSNLVCSTPAVAITYGRISNYDPVSLYVLTKGGYGTGGATYTADVSREDYAPLLEEYTYKQGIGWTKTWEKKLWVDGMTQFHADPYPMSDVCMANGRNEVETDSNGNEVDKFKRFYLSDTHGNLWECSMPPRRERPGYNLDDELGFDSNTGLPPGQNGGNGSNGNGHGGNAGSRKPTILGK